MGPRSLARVEDEAYFNTPVSPIREELSKEEGLQVPRSLGLGIEAQSRPATLYPASPNIPDELFFDLPSPSQAPVQINDEERTSTPYLIFEPVVEEESSVENIDWRRYDPPQELLRSQDGTSYELESLLECSIERIQARHVDEDQRRAAASRIERPLARAGRVSGKPRRQVSYLNYLFDILY
jgi:hypothetical protein